MKRTRMHAAAAMLAAALAWPASARAQVSPDILGTSTPQILAGTVAALPSCAAWRPAGICFWLRCTPFGCSIETYVKVSHYVPDLIVSSYGDPLNHPWTDIGKPVSSLFSKAGSSLMGSLLDASAATARENQEIATFKSVDAIGNPVGQLAALAGGGGLSMPASIAIPTPEELVKFPAVELPRILRLWATVPAQMASTMANDARALAQNPASLLAGFADLPGQLTSIQTPFGSIGDMMNGGFNLSFLGIGGSGGSSGSGSGGNGGSFGLAPGALQEAILSAFGGPGGDMICPGGSQPFNLYYHSDLDSWFWRSMIPLDMLYPQAWIPGFGEVGNALTNTWGSVYPRTGHLVQSHPAKSSAVLSARVHSIVSQQAQAHIYKKLETPGGYKYFARFADPRWQPVHPVMEKSCLKFGTNDSLSPFSWRDFKTSPTDGYIWNMWTRYECCKSRGAFLFSIP